MTNEEAILILEEVKEFDDSMYQYNSTYMEALDIAIKALSEPTIPLSVIEKIKAEIEAEYILKHYDDGLADALEIIDRKVNEVKGDKE